MRRIAALGIWAVTMLTTVFLGPFSAPAKAGTARIVGGDPSTSYPFLVRLSVTSRVGGLSAAPQCGGTLVARKVVLTAAHCTRVTGPEGLPIAPDSIWGFVGRDLTAIDTRLAAGATARDLGAAEVVAVKTFPSYSPETRQGDVALLFLDKQPADSVPVRIASRAERELWSDGKTQTIAGYGVTRAPRPGPGGSAGPPSSVSLTTTSPVMSDALCGKSLGTEFDVATMVCLETNGTGACFGDSGGPMLAKAPDGAWLQTGVVSWGFACAAGPSVYTRVADEPIRSWVRETVGSEPDPDPPLVDYPVLDPPVEYPVVDPPVSSEPSPPVPLSDVGIGNPPSSGGQNPPPVISQAAPPESPKPSTVITNRPGRMATLAVTFGRDRRTVRVRVACLKATLCQAAQKVTVNLLGKRTRFSLPWARSRTAALNLRLKLTAQQRSRLMAQKSIVVAVRARALGFPGASARLVQSVA